MPAEAQQDDEMVQYPASRPTEGGAVIEPAANNETHYEDLGDAAQQQALQKIADEMGIDPGALKNDAEIKEALEILERLKEGTPKPGDEEKAKKLMQNSKFKEYAIKALVLEAKAIRSLTGFKQAKADFESKSAEDQLKMLLERSQNGEVGSLLGDWAGAGIPKVANRTRVAVQSQVGRFSDKMAVKADTLNRDDFLEAVVLGVFECKPGVLEQALPYLAGRNSIRNMLGGTVAGVLSLGGGYGKAAGVLIGIMLGADTVRDGLLPEVRERVQNDSVRNVTSNTRQQIQGELAA